MVEYVHIGHATADHPVYHRHDNDQPFDQVFNLPEPDEDPYRRWVTDWYEKAPCGVKLTLCATMLQRDRADLFARPCRRCYPDG